MNTPIYDFIQDYTEKNTSRFHMPGHKGAGPLGIESLDITEILGADCLESSNGIIAESERNTAMLFNSGASLFSTEGSSQAIRSMLYLALLNYRSNGNCRKPIVVATRNAHKAFITAAVMLDFEIEWIWPEEKFSLCSAKINAGMLDKTLSKLEAPAAAVYLTTPDYLGGQLDVNAMADVCHRHQTLLLVDNAHGAYLRFLPQSQHPMDCGADMCCDSAHKTLPVLTGGAYLHISRNAPPQISENGKFAMSLFGSTSPSYLILQSLDLCNRYLYEEFPFALKVCKERVDSLKYAIRSLGWNVFESDALRVTVFAPMSGYSGNELADIIRNFDIECEYSDPDYMVLMISPCNTEEDFARLEHAFGQIPIKSPIKTKAFSLSPPHSALSVRSAALVPSELINISDAKGRILAIPSVSCPPAIPICVSGETIADDAIEIMEYYGITTVLVVKN